MEESDEGLLLLDSDEEERREEGRGEHEKEGTSESFQATGLLREMRRERRQHRRTTEAKMARVQRLANQYLAGAATIRYRVMSELKEKFK